MKYLGLLVLLASLEACSPTSQNRVDLVVRNRSSNTVRLRASTMIFSQTVILKPGQAWMGWWDRRFLGKDAAFEIEDASETPPK